MNKIYRVKCNNLTLNELLVKIFGSVENGVECFITETDNIDNNYAAKEMILIIKGPFDVKNFGKWKKKFPHAYLVPEDITEKELAALKKVIEGEVVETGEVAILGREQMEKYGVSALDKLEQMFKGLENDDLEVIGDQAHKIAGSGKPYGYQALGDICRQLDGFLQKHQGKSGDVKNVKDECAKQLRLALLALQKIEI
jgi:HPt (histidine-containing phosphotransfer) domain-containing protein